MKLSVKVRALIAITMAVCALIACFFIEKIEDGGVMIKELTTKVGLFAFLTPIMPIFGINKIIALTMGACAIVACFFISKLEEENTRARDEIERNK